MKKLLTSLLCVVMITCFMPGLAWADTPETDVVQVANPDGTGGTYTTLVDAVKEAKNGATIKLLQDCQGAGIGLFANPEKGTGVKNLIFDFGGFTYTCVGPAVGSPGTESQAFHLEKGCDIVLMNGTLKIASEANDIKMGIQNYCNLTLDNFNVDASENNSVSYAMSNNYGDVVIQGTSSITASEGNVAFDVYYWPNGGYSDGVTVIVNTTGTISGKIEYGDDGTASSDTPQKATLEVKSGNIQGEIDVKEGLKETANITVTGGTFSDKESVKSYVVDGSQLTQNQDGTFSLAPADDAVVQIGTTGFTTVNAAINAASAGDIIVLIKNVTEDVVVPETANVTLDLKGFILTNVSDHTIYNKGTLTVIDSSSAKTGRVDNVTHAKAALYNDVGATATLNGGEFTRSQENGINASENGGNSYYAVLNHGTMVINEGTKVTQNGHYSSLLENGWQNGSQNTTKVESVLTINGGEFTGGLNTIKNDDYGKLTINDGNFKNTTQASLLNWNEAEINGGTFTSDQYAILNGYADATMDKGKLTIKGGIFESNLPVFSLMGDNGTGGAIEISGGTFTSDTADVFAANLSGIPMNVIVSGGTYSSDVPAEHLASGMDTYGRANGTFTVAAETTPGQTPSIEPTPGYYWAVDENGNYVEKLIYIPPTPTVEKPTVETDAGATYKLSSDGTTATIIVADGYELTDVTVNGVSKGAVTTVTGLKTGDKVVITTTKLETEAEKNARIKAGVKATTLKIYSKSTATGGKGEGWIRVTWVKSKGYKVDGYELYRGKTKATMKRYDTTKYTAYKNANYLKKGQRYYYKVRGYRTIDGEKVYTQWSKTIYRLAR